MQVLASQLPFLANRNAELAVPPLFWPVNCIKIGGHVALLSGPTVYTLYCGITKTLIGRGLVGGHVYSCIHVLPDDFLFKSNSNLISQFERKSVGQT